MERNNEEKLELLADLLEPVSIILTDKEITGMIQKDDTKWVAVISAALRKHKKELVEIMAHIDGVEVDKYEVNLLKLPTRLMEFINRPEVQELFTGQSQIESAYSGSATGNTEDGAK